MDPAVAQEGLDAAWLYDGEATDLEPEHICLLGRTRYAFDAVVAELEGHGVGVVQRIEQGALFESRLGRMAHDVLKLTENPGDMPARRRLLEELGDSGPEGSASSEELADALTMLRAYVTRGDLPIGFAKALFPSGEVSANGLQAVSGLLEVELSPDQDEMMPWQRDQKVFRGLLTAYEVSRSAPNRSLSGFLRMLARQEDTPLSAQAVRALTPHRARGLGFKVVVVLGMNEGTFPHYRATSAEELDEERRVVYVAASRAARALLITRPRERRSRYGNWYPCRESRFVGEMGLAMQDL